MLHNRIEYVRYKIVLKDNSRQKGDIMLENISFRRQTMVIEGNDNPIAVAKKRSRQMAASIRAGAMQQDKEKPEHQRAECVIPHHFKEVFSFVTGKRITGYAAMRTELPLWNLLEILQHRGAVTGLPIVIGKDAPLSFHRWQKGDALQEGVYGELTPFSDVEAIIPNIILVPLLAYSKKGYRLGYGGGFYDRTVAYLRAHGVTVQYIGVAYSAQQLDEVPFDSHDVKLDAIITEQGIKYFG